MRPKRQIPAELIAEIEHRTASGESTRTIAAAVSLGRELVAPIALAWRDRNGVAYRPQDTKPPHALTPDTIAKIGRLTSEGVTAPQIATRLGLGHKTVARHATAYRRASGIKLYDPKIAAARAAAREARALSPADLAARHARRAAIREMAAEVQDALAGHRPVRDVARGLGLTRKTVRRLGHAMLEQVKEAGTLCVCGRPLWHVGTCGRWTSSGRPVSPEEIERLRAHLLAGGTVRTAQRELDMPRNLVKREVRALMRDPVAARQRAALRAELAGQRDAQRKREAAARRAPSIPSSFQARARDPLYARIAAMVPGYLDQALRDDIISDAYMAMLEEAA